MSSPDLYVEELPADASEQIYAAVMAQTAPGNAAN